MTDKEEDAPSEGGKRVQRGVTPPCRGEIAVV
jgi:hypothetical protein